MSGCRVHPTLLRSIASLALLLATGCYGFAGGGLPEGLRTVAVLPFDNQTAEPTLTQEVNGAVREAVESRLGLRPAAEDVADVVVKGVILRYDPDVPVAFTGVQDGQPNQRPNVTSRLVQLTVQVEVTDVKRGRPIFQQGGLLVQANYDPGRELDGRRRALDQLVTQIVQGAQSQW